MSEPIPQLESVSVDGLPDEYRADWETMLSRWQRKLSRNRLRSAYYNGANRIKNLGIAVPDTMIDFEEVVGWPAKAVDVLANRIRFDGFVTTGDDTDPLGLDRLLRESDFTSILLQATRSALIHSCSFVNVAGGRGQPISVFFRSALYETGIWDDAAHALRCALAIVSLTDDSVNTGMARPRELVLYEPDETLRIRLSAGRYEVTDRMPNTLGHVPVYVLAYHQDLHRPFGRSRVNREVMSLTDTAVRTMLRMEVSAEFYSSPQRALLGADEPPADKDGNPLTGWQASISKMLAIGRDADGNLPSIQQFAQMTMQPHTDMLRALAGRFSGATGVPMAQLGVMTDSGPSSAEAIAASETELVIEARNTCDAFGDQLCKAAQDMAVLNGTSPDDEALNNLKVNWRDPERPSQAAVADAVLKIVQALPWTANSRVILEKLQFSDADITRMLSDKRRAEATNALDGLLRSGANATDGTRTGGTTPGVAGGGGAPGTGGTGGTMEADRRPDAADQA